MDHIKTQLDRLTELDADTVSELQSTIIAEFEQVEAEDPTPESVEAMTELANMLDTVRGEVKRREAQSEELAAAAAEASARVRAGDNEGEEEVVIGEDETLPEEEVIPGIEDEEVPPIEEEEEDELKKVASTDSDEGSEFSTDETPEAPVAQETEASTEEEETPSEEEETKETEASAEAPTEAEASTTEETTDEQNAQEEAQTVTAAVEGTHIEVPADRRPVAQENRVPVAITAGADIQGIAAGSKLTSMRSVAEAFETRLRSVRHVQGGDGEQLIVASVRTDYPEERTLDTDLISNEQKIKTVVGPEALAASGGFAAPLNVAYDIPENPASDARPVRDALPRFQADRGGVRFFTAPQLQSYVNAVGIWTNTDDVAALGRYDNNDATPVGPTKNVLLVGGASTQDAWTYAVTLQLQFGNFMTRSFPELIARHNELALIQHARQAELKLLTEINAQSTQITADSTLGFARDFLSTLRRASVTYRSRNRIDAATQLRAIVPTWVVDAIAADLVMQMPGDDALNKSRAEIEGYLRGFNINLVESLDQNTFGAQTTGALQDWPAEFTWFLFPEGTFLFLDGGTLDLGIIRDSGLVSTNDYRMFTETFEGVAKVGGEAYAVTSTVRINGAAAALQDTVGVA